MPMIDIKFDDIIVSPQEMSALSEALCLIVSTETQIQDVFAYAVSANVSTRIAPIEVFVSMSAQKITNLEELSGVLGAQIKDWKISTGFKHPINLSVIPMQWNIQIGI
jgi:hypothetical protein